MMELRIKNMVCDRCIKTVREEIEAEGMQVHSIELGKVMLDGQPEENRLGKLRGRLIQNGFELIDDRKNVLIDQIKNLIIGEIQHHNQKKPESMNFSEFLSQHLGYDYSYLSQLFSSETGQTVEQYIIAQRVEKAKEMLSYNELTVSEIAWKLGYSSVAHFSNQFKKITGQTPAQFKNSGTIPRIPLDKIGKNK